MAQQQNSWLKKDEYPFSSNFFSINGNQLHYIDEGKGDILLFVHGTPTWSFEYRNIIKELRTSYRCIAIDHIGFGLSEKPEIYDYSTINHSRTLEKFILEKNLNNITLVVHDFGGPIGLNVAIKHPERFKSFVIINSWLWSSKADPDFQKLSKVLKNPLLPFLYRYLDLEIRILLPSIFGEKKLNKNIKRHYIKPFKNKSERNGTVAFAHSLLNDQEWFEELWNKKEAITDKPTLLIWGMKDPLIKPILLDKFQSGFSTTQTLKLETCGHIPHEEEPDRVTEEIKTFLQNGG
ncbi:MAG: alpha/beta fold hydrolase [Balneolaceae bacterium]|nr:alpha/beta fold hydrolase [Balneolaceae bacterium]